MPNALQEFFANTTQKAADDLTTAFLRLPEDKRGWSPDEKARTALDQMAECAILNGYTVSVINDRKWPTSGYEEFAATKQELLAGGWDAVSVLLKENTAALIATVRMVPDDTLGVEIDMPWGNMTVSQVIAFPHWNLCYHEGQINYIASILGCLN